MVQTDHVVLEKDGDIARVWLNRPHKKNAVTVELLHRLDEIIVEVDNDPELKVSSCADGRTPSAPASTSTSSSPTTWARPRRWRSRCSRPRCATACTR